MSDDVKVGDRMAVVYDSDVYLDGDAPVTERIERWQHGDTLECLRARGGDDCDWGFRNARTGGVASFSGVPTTWKRLPREEAKPGPVVRAAASESLTLPPPGMAERLVDAATEAGGALANQARALADIADGIKFEFATWGGGVRVVYTGGGGGGGCGPQDSPPPAAWTKFRAKTWDEKNVTFEVPPPPKCRTGCTPVAPCRTELVCPAWREDAIAVAMRERKPLVLRSLLDDQGTHEPSTSGFGGGFVGVWRR